LPVRRCCLRQRPAGVRVCMCQGVIEELRAESGIHGLFREVDTCKPYRGLIVVGRDFRLLVTGRGRTETLRVAGGGETRDPQKSGARAGSAGRPRGFEASPQRRSFAAGGLEEPPCPGPCYRAHLSRCLFSPLPWRDEVGYPFHGRCLSPQSSSFSTESMRTKEMSDL